MIRRNDPGGLVGNLNDTSSMMVYRRLSRATGSDDVGDVLLGTTFPYTWAPEKDDRAGYHRNNHGTRGGKILGARHALRKRIPPLSAHLDPISYPDWHWGRATKVEEGSPIARTTAYTGVEPLDACDLVQRYVRATAGTRPKPTQRCTNKMSLLTTRASSRSSLLVMTNTTI